MAPFLAIGLLLFSLLFVIQTTPLCGDPPVQTFLALSHSPWPLGLPVCNEPTAFKLKIQEQEVGTKLGDGGGGVDCVK